VVREEAAISNELPCVRRHHAGGSYDLADLADLADLVRRALRG
jgi:hypothetical protein